MSGFPGRFIVGLDLGQARDPTAMAILKAADSGLVDSGGNALPKFDCVHLERFHLGTPYPEIVARTVKVVDSPALHYAMDPATLTREDYARPQLVIDATGVGRPVVDLVIDARPDAEVIPVTIVGGDSVTADRWNQSGVKCFAVSKKHLVGAVQAGMQSGRLRFNPTLFEAETLRQELLSFQVRVTEAGNETFNAREGTHDDLVLAVAVAVWVGSRPVHYGSWGPPLTSYL